MSPLGITALLLAAFAAFAWFSVRKLAIVAALQPEVRWDHPWHRLRTVVTNGLLQQRMIRREWKPGVMHTIIFLGFVSLLVRKLQLVVIGFDAEFALTGSLGDAFTVWKDLVEVGVLLAVGYAFYRRLLLKPARLEPNREGLLVLGLIAAIMITDFAFDAFRFAQLADSVPAIAHERAHAPIGGWLAALVSGWSPSALATAAAISYWTQMTTGLCLPGADAARRTLPHRHRAARALLPSWQPGQCGADGRPEPAAGRLGGRKRAESRGAQRGRPRLEGRPGRVHLHRMRSLQGCVPGIPDRQAALDERRQRQPEAPPAPTTRGHPRRGRGEGEPAGPGGRRHQRRHALVVHDLRLLRSGLPHRTRTAAEVLSTAPASRDDGGRVSRRTEERVRRVRSAVEPVGTARGHARRLGEGPRRAAHPQRRGHGRGRVVVLRGFRGILRPERPEDRTRLRRNPA